MIGPRPRTKRFGPWVSLMGMRRADSAFIAVAFAACLSVAEGIAAQTPPTPRPGMPARDQAADAQNRTTPVGTATVSGMVVVAGAGTPARRARVTLSEPEMGRPRTTTTDDQGRFSFTAVAAGRYSLSANKPGHIAGVYGQARPGRPGTPIQIGDGEKFEAQLQITRGGVLTGTVLDEAGEAVPGTQVRAMRFVIQNGQRTLQQAGNGSTDDRGIYRIFGLQPGDYVIGAQPRNAGDGSTLDALRGEMEALQQRIAAARTGEGPPAAMAARLASVRAAIADTPDAPSTGYAQVFFPGTTALSQAGSTTLAPGEERSGLDFQLQRVPVARIEGLIVNSTGQPVQNVQVTLIDLSQAVAGAGNQSGRADNDGRFRFSNVAPGQYRIAARAVVGEGPARPAAPRGPAQAEQVRLWASADVTVDGRDLANVALSLQQGVSATGRLVFQGTTSQPPDLTRLRVTLIPADAGPGREPGGPANGRVDASGRFTVTSIVPGRYRLGANGLPQGWSLQSAIVDGQDTLDFPFEVRAGQTIGSATLTFTDQRAELTGALVDGAGRPAPGYTLILYPADQRYWHPQSRRIRTARPATDGRFLFGTVPPGDYKIAPVVDVEPGAWQDPAFLQELDATALRVSIAEGEKKVQNVRLAGG
jgi:protocatechuate 3,4-dioxygenase beta subunit